MERMQLIDLYGEGITDFESSPFEMIETFHIRSELHHSSLTKEQQKALAIYDVKLLSNALKIFEYMDEVYDFKHSTEPLDEWWWHLDLLFQGEIRLNAIPIFDDAI